MNFTSRMRTPCTITKRTQDDANPDVYGNPTYTDSTTDTRCFLFQENRSEGSGINDNQASRWKAYFPAGTVLDGHDTVTISGTVYELFGPPWPAYNPLRDQVEYVEATLVRVS